MDKVLVPKVLEQLPGRGSHLGLLPDTVLNIDLVVSQLSVEVKVFGKGKGLRYVRKNLKPLTVSTELIKHLKYYYPQ